MTNATLKRLLLAISIMLCAQPIIGIDTPEENNQGANLSCLSETTKQSESNSQQLLRSDYGYCQLMNFEQDISRALYILIIRDELENQFGYPIPQDVMHFIVKIFTPQNYNLELSDSLVQDEDLLKFKFLCFLTGLGLDNNSGITDKGIAGFMRLTYLDLRNNSMITNERITGLTNLTTLNLWHNKMITNDGITGLTNLTTLNLSFNTMINNDGIRELTNLAYLDLHRNCTITNDGVSGLRKLIDLNLSFNALITHDGITGLTNLTNLNLSFNALITHDGITGLTNLTSLKAPS